jgi:hypothetical protein
MWLVCSLLAAFWVMQVAVMLLLHCGNTARGRWWPCYLTATGLGVISTITVMWLFMLMDANLGLGLAAGVAYVLSQFALITVIRVRPSAAQIVGAGLTALGLFLLALGTPS